MKKKDSLTAASERTISVLRIDKLDKPGARKKKCCKAVIVHIRM